jgi:uncharacterized protein (TIGR02001 family)
MAQEESSSDSAPSPGSQGGGWSLSVGAGTDNRSKNASKSNGDPFISGTAEWESRSGFFYAGPSFETIKSNGSDVEFNAVVGARPYLAGFDIDVSAVYKVRPGSDAGLDDEEWQVGAVVERSVGPARALLRVEYAFDAFGSTDSYVWTEAEAGWAFTNKLEGSVAIGKREQKGSVDYIGWNVGATYALTDALELDLRYHDTDANSEGEQYEEALVASVNYSF